MVKIKELIELSSLSSSSSSSDPYSLFLYTMNSPVTRDRYTTRLSIFFLCWNWRYKYRRTL